MSDEKSKVVIQFDNEQAASHFASWLCGQGEQDYWVWMEYREQEEEGDITAIRFNYNSNTITTECGRLDQL